MKNYLFLSLRILLVSSVIYFHAEAQTPSATDNIIITNNSAIINNLPAIGPVEITKSAFMGNKDNLTKKAELELKQQALAKGGNIVFVTTNDFINDPNSYFKKVHMAGVVYKSTSVINGTGGYAQAQSNDENVISNIDNGLDFKVVSCVGNTQSQTVTFSFILSNPTKPDQAVTIYNHSSWGGDVGVTTAYNEENSKFTCNLIKLANNSITGYTNIQATLINGLSLKGSVTFSNVLPSSTKLALIELPIRNADLEDKQNDKHGIIKIKNVKIDWGGEEATTPIPTPNTSVTSVIKNLNNGIDFNIIDCVGDAAKQRVTLSYSFSNPRKVNQKIQVGNTSQYGHSVGIMAAYDNDNNLYKSNLMTLANNTTKDYSDIFGTLNYGTTLKGSATFIGILPTVSQLSLIKLPVRNCNLDGGGDEMHGFIEIKNVTINWNNATSPGASNVTLAPSSDYITYDQLTSRLNRGEKATNTKVILNNIYFETNDAALTEASKSHLGNVMLLLIKYPNIKATFTGNTDNIGRDDDNLNLSTNRAKSVVDYLVSKGISRDRLFYQGLGSSKPIADNSTEEGRAQNRRTEMEIISQ